jgi:hypothetical protein
VVLGTSRTPVVLTALIRVGRHESTVSLALTDPSGSPRATPADDGLALGWGPTTGLADWIVLPATVLAAMELRSSLGRLSRRAWPRRIVVLMALLAVVAIVLPASASTRDYRGAITGGGTTTIRATFKAGRATKVKITWSDVPTICIPIGRLGEPYTSLGGLTSLGFPAESYSSTTSGTLSGAVVPAVPAAPVRSFYLQHVGSDDIGLRVSGRFNRSYSRANGVFAWQDIEAPPGFGPGIRATCSLVQADNPTTDQNFAVTEG